MRRRPSTQVCRAALLASVALALLALGLLSGPAAGADAGSAAATASLRPCPTHDPTRWHGLVDPVRRCRYDHEHKDDPRVLDGLFGPVGAWFGSPGRSISYPWQTFQGAGEGYPEAPGPGLSENELKHTGYGWGVRKGMVCRPAFGAEGCLTDIRLQVHAMPTVHDATTRFHSYSIEARGCIESRCGIVREGGWIDYGRLRVDEGKPSFVEHVRLPGDPKEHSGVNPRRIHKSPRNEQRDATWYTQGGPWNHHLTWLGIRFETAAPVVPSDPFRELDWCTLEGRPRGACPWNGSWLEVHLVPITVPRDLDARDGKRDGLVTLRSFRDRYGAPARGCRRVSLDCVPLVLERMPVGTYQYRDDVQGVTAPDHDVSPAAGIFARTGRLSPPSSWWIAYPGGGDPHAGHGSR
jgi:hypothetical protein